MNLNLLLNLRPKPHFLEDQVVDLFSDLDVQDKKALFLGDRPLVNRNNGLITIIVKRI